MAVSQKATGVYTLAAPVRNIQISVAGWQGGRQSSSGLRTPRPPWFRTCVKIIVVATSRCPSNSWIVRMS